MIIAMEERAREGGGVTPEPVPAVAVRTLHRIEELATAEALFAATWPGQPPATAALLKAIEHAGGYVAGAFAAETPAGRPREMLGAAAGFLAAHPGPALHSHLAAVVPAARGLGVGYALKIHQRAWAAEHALTAVTWTFDPLVRRNAWFNISKLGAAVEEYLIDFYGPMDDGINDGDASDRLLAVWPVAALADHAIGIDRVTSSSLDQHGLHDHGVGGGEVAVALEEVDGRPVVREVPYAVRLVAVATPADVESLRHTDRDLAHAWRIAVREQLAPRLAGGGVVGFTRNGSYLVDPASSASSASSGSSG
jgi:predicted GNAT superfamily acetyltransferase